MPKLSTGTLVEYRDGHMPCCIANGRIAKIVRQCSKQGDTRQYVVEIISCPVDWKPEHKKQQIGKLHFWWDTDFIVIHHNSALAHAYRRRNNA